VASLRLNNVTYTKCKDKAIILNNHFTSFFTKEDKSNIPPFDDYRVTALLSNLEGHKACGPDEIPKVPHNYLCHKPAASPWHKWSLLTWILTSRQQQVVIKWRVYFTLVNNIWSASRNCTCPPSIFMLH